MPFYITKIKNVIQELGYEKEYTLNEDGFRAVWYEGSTFRDKVIIYLGGAKTTEEQTISSAQYLIDKGYSVLFSCY